MVARNTRIAVIGGSVGALFAANMLRNRGWQVDVFERTHDDLATRGAGIARHPDMRPVFAAAGLDADALDGAWMAGRLLIDRAGNELAFLDFPQYLSAWSAIFTPLFERFGRERYHFGKEMVGLDERGDEVLVRFADGSVFAADLVVGADGFRSAVRAACAPETQPEYAGYFAWRGVIPADRLDAGFVDGLFSKYSFCFLPGGQLAGFPLMLDEPGAATPRGGARLFSVLWYDHVGDQAEFDDLLTDESGRLHAWSIPPALIRRDHVERMRARARAELPPAMAEMFCRIDRYLLQPIYDVMSTRMAWGRACVLGDAAFVVRPHVGTGVLKAGEDALALAEALSAADSVPAALEAYDAARLQLGIDTVRFARHLGSTIGADVPKSAWPNPDLATQKATMMSSARPPGRFADAMARFERYRRGLAE